jgi:hypothetical protein
MVEKSGSAGVGYMKGRTELKVELSAHLPD